MFNLFVDRLGECFTRILAAASGNPTLGSQNQINGIIKKVFSRARNSDSTDMNADSLNNTTDTTAEPLRNRQPSSEPWQEKKKKKKKKERKKATQSQ